MSRLTRPATTSELAWIAPPAVRSQVVADAGELAAMRGAEPWRVRVTERGEAAILGRWREHLNDCAVFGLWCAPRRVPMLVTDLLEVAREEAFARLVGPLVPEREAGPYLDSGLRVFERVVVMRARAATTGPGIARSEELLVREATESDLSDLLRLDDACFDPFWHYDMPTLRRLAHSERVAVGTIDDQIVGYTLSTLRSGDGSLGRLAVAPSSRRRGIGWALASEAIGWMSERGARRIVLSTQEDNTASRALYAGLGFEVTGDRLVACVSGALLDPTTGERR